MHVFARVSDLLDAVGTELGPGDWTSVDQERITAFAAATDDEQWIHVDPERAARGPFGGTIAHGYLSLSLLPSLTSTLFRVGGVAMGINYGLDRVRFLQPVRSGSRVRAAGVITSADEVRLGVRLGVHVTVEIEGEEKPALVADTISVFVPESETSGT